MAITKRSDKGSALTYTEMDDNFDAIAPRTSNTGAIEIPAGTTSDRPGSASDGMFRYNTSLNSFEGYSGGVWGSVGSGGANGGGQVNQNAWSEFIVAGQSSVSADNATDSVTLVGGTNITITTDAAADEITFAATFNQDFAYSSLTGAPTIPSALTDLGITDGSANQVLSTDGNGNFTFVNQTGGGGAQGVQGITGLQGPLGTTLQGIQGFTGATGADGADGVDGQPGIQGPAGSIQGVQGSDGTGAQGVQGPIGFQGPAAQAQGTQGTEGPPGDEGVQGFQGFQGPAGSAQGTQGIQGGPGPAGFGFQGIQGGGGQGVQGIQGDLGPAGFGAQGHQGVQGNIGPGGTGPQGIQGMDAAGAQGPQGIEGGDGPFGPQGIQGPAGSVQGIQGNAGIGDDGAQGIQGISVQGTTGADGAQGSQGTFGIQGTQGLQGLTGIGEQGIQGTTGLQGADGLQGITAQGIQGIQGPSVQGADGTEGPAGTQGTAGSGNQGAQGIQGTTLQGFQGPGGGIGIQGIQGPQSIQGMQGPVGIQGPSDGANGADGNQGVQGPAGSAQGIQGTTGIQGDGGFQGLQGVDGSGAQGVQGITGIQGPSNGPQGTTGIQGVQGTDGTQGLTGAGTQGIQGTTGLTGNGGAQGVQGPTGSTTETDTLATVTNRGSTTTSSITVAGNIEVEGTVSDGGRIILNSGQSGSPSSSSTNWSYIDVERGISPNVSIRWHEGFDRWEFTNDGSTYYAIPTSSASSTLDAVLTAGDESDTPITLFRGTSGNATQGSLIFENRDQTPNVNASIGDIRFFGDGISGNAQVDLVEYARINSKPSLIDSANTALSRGYLDFEIKTGSGIESKLVVGVDPFRFNSPNTDPVYDADLGTLVRDKLFVESNLYLIDEVATANDIYSDTNAGIKFSGYDSTTLQYNLRSEIWWQNNMLRLSTHDMNAATPHNTYAQLTLRPENAGGLTYTNVVGGSPTTYDVYTDDNAMLKVRSLLEDGNTLKRMSVYANTEVMSARSDFGGFNGGAANNADIVPGYGYHGTLAFFQFSDSNNGSAGQNRYIPAGHTEEVPHGMGILRDSGQHSSESPRWDPFGGPDFRISLDNTASDANYFFGSTSTSNDSHPTNLIITNSDYTPLDGTKIGRIKFKGGEDTYTQYEEYALITVTMQDTAAGAYDGRMALYVKGNGGTGDNANIGLTLDGNGSVIRSRANHHYFGAFPLTAVDNDTVPTDNYIKIIADDDATRQVIQSAGDMHFSVDTAVSAQTILKLTTSDATFQTQQLVINDPTPEANNIVNEHAILDLKSNGTLVGRVAGTLDASANPVLKLGYDTSDFIYIKSDGLTLTDANTAFIGAKSQTDVSYTNFTSMTGDSGVTEHDLSTGSVFFHSFIAGNITANFTNVYFANDTFFTVRLVMSQGGTAYMPTAVQIGGVAQTIQWDGGSAPTGTANATDVVEFDIYCFQTNSYTVLARHTMFD